MTATQAFWKWFLQHEEELFHFDAMQETVREAIFDQLHSELMKIDQHLVFEFGPSEAKRVFVISADGIRSAFPAVTALASAAPVLDRWQVVAFRPRRELSTHIKIGDKCADPKDVEYILLDNGRQAGLSLFMPGFEETDNTWRMIGYLLLDEALGEFDVESRLAFIEMLSPETVRPGQRHSLTELPAQFDDLVSRLEGRSGTPS